jgi:hypothetical protein
MKIVADNTAENRVMGNPVSGQHLAGTVVPVAQKYPVYTGGSNKRLNYYGLRLKNSLQSMKTPKKYCEQVFGN